MNRYLLLRDNKQSGPYTVEELIDKGIKPYDLVWLEGKSAAWRYPSEIDELKAYAPAVEEQPYDRFYKKPETEKEKKSTFQPGLAQEAASPSRIVPPSKKVYINFPGQKKAVPVIQPIRSLTQAPAEQTHIIMHTDQLEEPKKQAGYASATATNSWLQNDGAALPASPIEKHSAPAPDGKLFYAVVAACFVLIVIISVLIINYGNQRSSIKQLNEMVQQMEKRQNEQNQSAKAALASRVLPVRATDQAIVPESEASGPLSSIGINAPSHGNSVADPSKSVAQSASPVSQPKNKPVTTNHNPDASAGPVSPVNGPGTAKNSVEPAVAKASVPSAANKNDTKENIFNEVSLTPNKFRTGMFGGIVNLQFTLMNNSSRELQRVSVEVKYFSPEKKLIKTQTVYFENVSPNSQAVLDVPKTSRGVSIDYSITDIRS